MPQVAVRRRLRWHHWLGIAIIILLLFALAARLYLPTWLTDKANQKLATIPNYHGSVQSIDVALYRGGFVLHDLRLDKIRGKIPVPFLSIASTDMSLQWSALLHGRVVMDVHLTQPELNFAISKTGVKQNGSENNWNTIIKQLIPLDVNLIEVEDGSITYRDFSSHPPVDIALKQIRGTARNLRNVEEKGVALPSSVSIRAESIGGGQLKIDGKLNILTRLLDMDMDAQIEHADLTAFNSFSEAYGALKFKSGTTDVYTEFAVKDGQVTGYVKPLIHGLSVDRIPKNSNPLEVAWASIASVLLQVFENQPHEQIATKVPLSGKIGDVQTDFWPTLGGIFRNAFIEAFRRGTEGEVSFSKAPAK